MEHGACTLAEQQRPTRVLLELAHIAIEQQAQRRLEGHAVCVCCTAQRREVNVAHEDSALTRGVGGHAVARHRRLEQKPRVALLRVLERLDICARLVARRTHRPGTVEGGDMLPKPLPRVDVVRALGNALGRRRGRSLRQRELGLAPKLPRLEPVLLVYRG